MPRRCLFLAVLVLVAAGAARGHSLTITQVEVTLRAGGKLAVQMDVDLSPYVGTPKVYAALSAGGRGAQEAAVRSAEPALAADLQLWSGAARVECRLRDFRFPHLPPEDFLDPTVDRFTTLQLAGDLPVGAGPLRLVVPPGARVSYPVAFTVRVPEASCVQTAWISEEETESDPFDWQSLLPVSPLRRLGTYLWLGFRHIVPEGADHVLFVLGLFFFGPTGRKLLWQTTLFTLAHATTLFLSSTGVFSLPPKVVEPAIALSIVCIALENLGSGRLGPFRLGLVFAFGLIHGLGFASSLSAVPFPRHGFLLALLGFNFGVDAGQLLVLALAFAVFGAFRGRPWFRRRVAVPCSLAIAAVGLGWAVQRIAAFGLAGHRGAG